MDAGSHDRHVEGVGRGQLLGREQPRQDGAAGGLVDGEEGLLHREQPEQEPHVVRMEGGLRPERRAGEDEPDRGDLEDRPPVHHVGQRTAPEPEDHQRDQTEHAREADVRRGAGDRVDLRRDGDHGQLGTDHGDDVGRPEPAEGGGGQRSRVREQSPEMHVRTLRPAPTGHGRAVGADARLVREPEAPRAVGGEPEPDPWTGADVIGRELGAASTSGAVGSGRGRSASPRSRGPGRGWRGRERGRGRSWPAYDGSGRGRDRRRPRRPGGGPRSAIPEARTPRCSSSACRR